MVRIFRVGGSESSGSRRRRSLRAALGLLGGLLLAVSTNAAAKARVSRVLRGAQIWSRPSGFIITIDFTLPLRVVAEPAAEPTKLCRIRLRALEEHALADVAPTSVLSWRESGETGLSEVVFERADALGGWLLLRFERPVTCVAIRDSDLEHLHTHIEPARAASIGLAARSEDRPAGARVRVRNAGRRVDRYLDTARGRLARNEVRTAVALLRKALELPESDRTAETLELLALAHQRLGQLAHAKAEYQRYLERFPQGEAAARVRQRLDALLTARVRRRSTARLRRRSGGEGSRRQLDFYGSASQYYRNEERVTASTGSDPVESALFSDIVLNARSRGDLLHVRAQLAANRRIDFLDHAGDSTRVNSAFVELQPPSRRVRARIGRQSRTTGGVLGRLDGAVLTYRIRPGWALNLVSGFPVDYTETSGLNSDRVLFGGSAEIGPFDNGWDAEIYAVDQRAEGISDRRAIGTEVRYASEHGSLMTLVDYDVSYLTPTILLLVGNLRLTDRTHLNLLYDDRASPVLTTRNALQGQTVGSLRELVDRLGSSTVRDLARDRTARSRTATLGVTHELRPDVQAGADLTLTRLSGTPASGGVDATDGTGNDYQLATRLTRTDWLLKGDYTTGSLQYSSGGTTDRIIFQAGGRYPLTAKLRAGPRLRIERRDTHGSNVYWSIRPTLRTDYRLWKVILEAEAGTEWTFGRSEDESDYFAQIGYRYDF